MQTATAYTEKLISWPIVSDIILKLMIKQHPPSHQQSYTEKKPQTNQT